MTLDENAPKKRKAPLHKGLKRTIQDLPFFSLTVTDHISVDIDWGSLQEFNDKSDRWNDILIKRFKKLHDDTLEECGISVQKVTIKGAPSERITGNKPVDVEDLDFLEDDNVPSEDMDFLE